MSTPVFKTTARKAMLLGALALGLAQVGCAHPVVMEPSVVISSRIGQAPIYAQVGIPAPVMVMPPPRVIYAPPQVVYAPPMHWSAPAWGRGHDHGRRWGPGRWDHHPGHGHGDRGGWRR